MASMDRRNFEKCMVVTNIRRGHNLVDKKIMGSPNIYVRVEIDGEVQHTQFAKDYSNPEWNEELKFEFNHFPKIINIDVKDDRMILRNLKIGHYSYNIDSSQIGNALQSSLQSFKIIDGTINLQDVTNGSLDLCIMIQPWSSSAISTSPNIGTSASTGATLNDINNIKEMYVTVVEATGFKQSNLFSHSDPYIECNFCGKSETTKVSSSKKQQSGGGAGTNNKTFWNETFVFPFNFTNLQQQQQQQCDLLFILKDEDIFKDDNMGRCRIKYNDLINYCLLSLQNHCEYEYTLPLLFRNNEQNGILRIKLKANDAGIGASNYDQTDTTKMGQQQQQQQQPFDRTSPIMNENQQQ